MELIFTRSKATCIDNSGHSHCLSLAFLFASNSLLNPKSDGGSRASEERMIDDCGYIMSTLKQLNVRDKYRVKRKYKKLVSNYHVTQTTA